MATRIRRAGTRGASHDVDDKSAFLANMSHELRTPLNGIIGFSEVMLERMFGEINEIEAGRMELDLTSFDVPAAIGDAVNLMRERASRRGLALDSAVAEALGIAPEDHATVFEEFRQVGRGDTKTGGTGLGLPLCRKFVELHGGRIWVESQPGQGATFVFTLPGAPA